MSGSLVNVHWYGGLDKLDSSIKYVGRPGPHGNRFSSKKLGLAKEDCVAFHRVDLYSQLIEDKDYFAKLKQDLDNRDLACWCAVKNKHVACHASNYLHVLSERHRGRKYDKTVYDYLIEDLKIAMNALNDKQRSSLFDKRFLDLYIAYGEVKIDVNETLRLFKARDTDPYLKCVWLATLVVDLELAVLEADPNMILYRLDRVIWNAFRFSYRPAGREGEPSPPDLKVRSPKKKKKD